jgi:hypothetical protein
MRTTLDLPDPLFRSLKARAAVDGKSLKDLFVEFAQQGLARREPAQQAPRNPFPVLVAPGGKATPSDPRLLTNTGIYELLYGEEDEKTRQLANPASSTATDAATSRGLP